MEWETPLKSVWLTALLARRARRLAGILQPERSCRRAKKRHDFMIRGVETPLKSVWLTVLRGIYARHKWKWARWFTVGGAIGTYLPWTTLPPMLSRLATLGRFSSILAALPSSSPFYLYSALNALPKYSEGLPSTAVVLVFPRSGRVHGEPVTSRLWQSAFISPFTTRT